jgi:hypothetical protein
VAFADTLRDKSTDAFSSCIPALVPAGVGMIMHLRAMANWTGSHRVELILARNNTEVIECGVHGRTVPGGMVNFYGGAVHRKWDNRVQRRDSRRSHVFD